jgi:hypothetical protein
VSPLRRRLLLRVVTAAGVGVVAITGASWLQRGPRDISVEVDLGLVPGVTAARVELWNGGDVPVGEVERPAGSGLSGPLTLRAPALGAKGEVRIELETEDGPRRLRRPLVAPAGSEVTIRCGETEP